MARRNQFMKHGETTFRQLLEANWKIPNEKILKHFELTADENGYPYIANWPDFIKEKDELEVFKTLMYYLLKKKLPLPLVTISLDDIKELFWRYKNKNISPFVHGCDLNSPLIHSTACIYVWDVCISTVCDNANACRIGTRGSI